LDEDETEDTAETDLLLEELSDDESDEDELIAEFQKLAARVVEVLVKE